MCTKRHRVVISLTAHHIAVIWLTAARQRGAENPPPA